MNNNISQNQVSAELNTFRNEQFNSFLNDLLGQPVIVRTTYGLVRGRLEKASTCADGRKGLHLSRGTIDKWISPDDIIEISQDL